MFLHLGGNEVVRNRDLVAILNAENGHMPGRIRATETNKLGEEIKAIVVTTQGAYYSPISSGTLKKRAECEAAQGD